MKNYHLDYGPPRCALKIDLKKAYDSISWGYILDILSTMGTHATLLSCIKACITTPMFYFFFFLLIYSYVFYKC